ncbi:hypothetical protein A2Z23_01905 [Candidatus Curtissbacteria bacterium RBG_16_39_7]|uniref:Uncharacterized protein n=1 Tax=Candidatus Curtissbacteria bacterium RBG_16_39_7 TaxID=1797707 RepID=A0A1F5G451_9BACT|nr:MAG: hypothetical protein A2Z23_01905 [Candidatus Curtissbacteria bacterium RBG_16_39_7]
MTETENSIFKVDPEKLEWFVLADSEIGVAKNIAFLKTPHETLGNDCPGNIYTVFRLTDQEEILNLGSYCEVCRKKPIVPLSKEKLNRAIATERKLKEVLTGRGEENSSP